MHIITSSHHVFSMDKQYPPVYIAQPKESLVFETLDALSNAITSPEDQLAALDWQQVNPATGPVFVQGAKPGDILAVRIDSIELADQAVVCTFPESYPLSGKIDKLSHKILPIVGEGAQQHLLFTKDDGEELPLPLNKMIGVIGTAPAGEPVITGTPGPHGGNLDTIAITEGVTVYLPVAVEGALLSLGDLHAAMGDGEVSMTGAEVAGRVTVTLELLTTLQRPTPFIESETHFMTVASHQSLETAVALATANMQTFLMDEYGFEQEEAAMFISLVGDVRISQVVNPCKTVRVELPKERLGE